jgi:apolipoprotein N-acyltransferase
LARFQREALAALSGVLLALSFPKFGHWAFAWLALAPLLLALRDAGARRAAVLGYITGFVSSLGILYWTALVVVQYGGLSLASGIAVMVLLCLVVALFPALFAWLVGRWRASMGPLALLLSPLAWVATEILRAHALYRFSWCLLGYSQQENLPAIQIASLTAVYGISFVVASASGVTAYAIAETRPDRRRHALRAFGAGLGLVLAHGAWALNQALPETGRIRVGLVQASILQEEKWDPQKAGEHLARHLELTRQAAAQGARLVVWPESALPFLYDQTPAVAAELQELAREKGLYLLFGNDDREGAARIFTGAKMLDPSGQLTLRYHKIRLVPFGEYTPMQPLLSLGGRYAAKLVQQVSDFTPGTEASVAPADAHPLGAFICYEAIFPDLVREFTARGAELLVNVTNDAWYGRTSAPHQHFAMAVFRAVENGRYLVRAANSGITAVVDPRGRVVERTGLFERTVLVRDVPFVGTRTFYSRHGDVFAWACFGAAVALTAGTFRKARA